MTVPKTIQQWQDYLMRPVDNSSLVVFRFLFGIVMGLYVLVYLDPNTVQWKYIDPQFFFSFPLFHFLNLKPLGEQMYLFFTVMGISACAFGLGIFYRLSLVVFFLTYGYTFLLEKAYYNNHYYLILLFVFLLFLMGAHRSASFDAFRRPQISRTQIPYWNIFIFRAQILIVYFYAGVTKVYKEWLDGHVMINGLIDHKDIPFIGSFLMKGWVVSSMSLAAMVFDLTIGFFLWYRPTRTIALILAIFFHIGVKVLFDIHMFPFVSLAWLVLFLEPETPRLWMQKISRKLKISSESSCTPVEINEERKSRSAKLVVTFVMLYLIIQFLLPLKHWFYPSNVNWTGEGHRFSWRMKSNNVHGIIKFTVIDPEAGQTFNVDNFSDINIKQYRKLTGHPDMILQYAHHLKRKYQKQGVKNPIVRADSRKALNNRKHVLFVDPEVNLAEVYQPFYAHYDWILPHPDER